MSLLARGDLSDVIGCASPFSEFLAVLMIDPEQAAAAALSI
jgi:hypothetical protein